MWVHGGGGGVNYMRYEATGHMNASFVWEIRLVLCTPTFYRGVRQLMV